MIFVAIFQALKSLFVMLISIVSLPHLPGDLVQTVVTSLANITAIYNLVNWIIPVDLFLELLFTLFAIMAGTGAFRGILYIFKRIGLIK